jgi:sugar phosphate isomerase/epimerase
MRSAVTVSLVPESRGGPFVYWDGLNEACFHAAALGFDAIEIFPPSAAAIDPAQLRPLLARHRLAVAAVGTGAGWVVRKWTLTHPDAAIRKRAREFIRAIIDLAADFHAPAIIGSMQGRAEGGVDRPQALNWLGEALDELGAHAATRGTALLLEPLNRYETNLCNRLGDTATWLDQRGVESVRLLADLFHMAIEEADLAAALRAAGHRIGHVHFADSNRRAMGMGHTDPAPIIAALRETGYVGFLSAEVLPLPDSAAAALQTIDSLRRCLQAR